jgi:transposase
MTELYELGGCSLAKIAVDFGASVPTIAKYLRREGVLIKKRGRPPRKALAPAPVVAEADEETKTVTVESEPASIFKF